MRLDGDTRAEIRAVDDYNPYMPGPIRIGLRCNVGDTRYDSPRFTPAQARELADELVALAAKIELAEADRG